MRAKYLNLVVVTLFLSLFVSATPVSATDAPAIDYCAKKTTGKVRAITEGTCKTSERSLGASPIIRDQTRPTGLIPQFKSRFKAAQAAANKKGHKLAITSGYRSLERQEFLYKRAIKRYGSAKAASKWVLPPEKSNHPWGLAIDINYGVGGTKGKKAAAWLEKNGYKYGLCRRYKNEWWHFEPLVTPGQKCPAMEPYAS
jgi:D-alanyl-D-alanine carboxypeptidase